MQVVIQADPQKKRKYYGKKQKACTAILSAYFI